mgnify:CR=1 FL=1
MTKRAYLTIDDGPSERFTDLIDFLHERKIPAVFFNRGDAMEQDPDAVRYGIERGYIMANHAYSHRRASTLSLEQIAADIERTEDILDDIYWSCGVERGPLYFRFPYMDRGMGPCLAEPKQITEEHEAAHLKLIGSGLGHEPHKPNQAAIEKKNAIQSHLNEYGFQPLPVQNVNLPWYANTEMASAIDSLCTFSTSDWALCERHKGKYGFETIDDLKTQIDNDPWLHDETSNHIILAHDQAEIYDVTTALIDYFCESGFEFLDFETKTH